MQNILQSGSELRTASYLARSPAFILMNGRLPREAILLVSTRGGVIFA